MSPAQIRPIFTNRHLAMLKAVEAGRGEALCGCAPDLLIDGRFCDGHATRVLFGAGLISTTGDGLLGQRVGARITDTGRQVLAAG